MSRLYWIFTVFLLLLQSKQCQSSANQALWDATSLSDNSIISEIYQAATDGLEWTSLRRSLFGHLGAEAGTLRFRDAGGAFANVLCAGEAQDDQYSRYYLSIDPVRSAVTRMHGASAQAGAIYSADEVVDARIYRRSEFYQDFARKNGRQHMLIGLLGDEDRTIISFFREGRPFGEAERSALSQLLPHLKNGLELRRRITAQGVRSDLGFTAFDALPSQAVVVDDTCSLLFANRAAKHLLSRLDSPIATVRRGAGRADQIIVGNGCNRRLKDIVHHAAHRGQGGKMRLHGCATEGRGMQQFVLQALPLPLASAAAQLHPVLLLICDLSRCRHLHEAGWHQLFGLTPAESAVAVALLGGQTADLVARERAVSLDTVRAQIRTVLQKTEAGNLRDLERMAALLSGLQG